MIFRRYVLSDFVSNCFLRTNLCCRFQVSAIRIVKLMSGEIGSELEDYHANLASSTFTNKINSMQSFAETLQENVINALGSDFLAVQNLKLRVQEVYSKTLKLSEEVHESVEQVSARFEQVLEPAISQAVSTHPRRQDEENGGADATAAG